MKTVFLDRDGVISRFTPGDYVKRWEEFEFVPGAVEALGDLAARGYRLILVSNQAGVGKGLFTREALDDVTARMEKVCAERGARFAAIYYCVHTDEDDCSCRKPKAGSFFRAAEEFAPLDLAGTFFIGDTVVDVEAGRNAGTRTILVLSGKTRTPAETGDWPVKPDFIAADLAEAARVVIGEDDARTAADPGKERPCTT